MKQEVPRTRFVLDQEEMDQINLPFPGQGGAQSFFRNLQGILQEDGTICLTDSEVGRIYRYARDGQGGYQGRLRKAFGRHLMEPFIF